MEDFITLTVVTAKLKKEVKNKLVELSTKANNPNSKKDAFGRDASFYESLGIDVPEELDTEDFPKTVNIDKEDYDLVKKPAKFRPDTITFMVDNEDLGSTLYINADITITVEETVQEVEDKIKLLKNGVK